MKNLWRKDQMLLDILIENVALFQWTKRWRKSTIKLQNEMDELLDFRNKRVQLLNGI